MQFAAAAHTHDDQSPSPHVELYTAQHAHDHAHIPVPPHQFHGEDGDCHEDKDDHPGQPHNCSVCILASQNAELDLGELWDNDPFETGLDVDTILSESVKLIRLNYQPLTRDDPEISSVIARLKPQRAPPVLRP